LTGSQYNGVATTFVLGSDGYVYKSVNGAAWSTVSAPGATHVQPLPGQGSALFSTATAISLVNSSGAITGLTALPAGVMV
ncbi:hypothetical protein, partial [Listeria monocytogenes]|uniref:hypothetical protein n=1 Tax=Listeria monocytogenes TaxID=1639 RepID=UPI003FA49382